MSDPISTDSLFELRLAWLKSISRIWSAMEIYPDDFLKNDTFSRSLVKENYNDYPADEFGAMGVLEKYKLFENPWKIELHVENSDNAPYWNPASGKYEVANPFEIEQVLLYIPEAPKENRTQAAADYYAIAPSIFGGFSTPDGNDFTGFNALMSGMGTSGEGGGSRFDVGNDTSPLYEFGAVLADALTLSWNSETFKNRLITKEPINPETGNIQVDEIGKAQKLLKENFDYDFPWNFDLVIGIDHNAKYEKTDNDIGTGFRWESSTHSRLVLVVPKPPAMLNEYGPLALASYNAGGSKYPFSCG